MKMVSRITAIGLAGVAICYLGLSGYVWYHDNKRSKQADVQASAVSENNKVLGFLREKGCDYCHTPSAELPAYYYIPGAKQLMDYDIKLGYKSFNLEAVRAALLADKPVSQSDLNKIEWVMQYETMPPTRYTALHWAGKVSDEERAEILAWIAKQRAEYYASNDIAPEHRNEPVQPIPQKLPTDAQKVALGFALYFFLKTPKYKQKILRTLRFSTQIRRTFGATDLIRTGDLLITSELLYQLSHSSTCDIL